MTWNESRSACEKLGQDHYMASIHSRKENAFVATLFDKNLLKSADGVWIGGVLTIAGTVLSWSDSTNVDVVNWDAGQPDYQPVWNLS